MKIDYHSRLIPIVLLGAILIVSLSFLNFDNNTLVGLAGTTVNDDTLYAGTQDFFLADELLLSQITAQGDLVITTNIEDDARTFSYMTGYIGVSNWNELVLVPSNLNSQEGSWNNSWIRGSATTTIPSQDLEALVGSSEELYVIVFICRLYDFENIALLPSRYENIVNTFGSSQATICGATGFDDEDNLIYNRWHLATINTTFAQETNPQNAVCGQNKQNFTHSTQIWPTDDFCSQGTLQGSTPNFPEQGSSVNWTCQGIDGGSESTCYASRQDPSFQEPPQPPETPSGELKQVFGNKYELDGRILWALNRVPSQQEHELDANGWPKYLNVPEDCPPADPNLLYHHGGSVANHGSPGATDYTTREGFFFGTGNTFTIPLTDAEVMAVPFVTPNKGLIHGRIDREASGPNWPRGSQYITISHCPGDFNHVVPEGARPLNQTRQSALPQEGVGMLLSSVSYTIHYAEDMDNINPRGYELEPNRRYFVNVRNLQRPDGTLSCSEDVYAPDSWRVQDGFGIFRTINGESLPVCAGSIYVHRAGRYSIDMLTYRAPYAGPCIDGTTPRSINHQGAARITNFQYSEQPRGFCSENLDTSFSYLVNAVCYDPYNVLPPITFRTRETSNGLAWEEGYQELVLSNYLCEYERATQGQLAQDVRRRVCAEHREGEVRIHHQPHPVVGNRAFEYVSQCQFDEQRGRFDWHIISSRPLLHGANIGYVANPQYTAHTDTCRWNDQEYPLGTIMTQTHISSADWEMRQGTHQYRCEQRTTGEGMPRFAHIEHGLSPVPERPLLYGVTYSVSFEEP